MTIADQLEAHAHNEPKHPLMISTQIDYFGQFPSVTPKPVRTSDQPKDMLRSVRSRKRDLEGARPNDIRVRRAVETRREPVCWPPMRSDKSVDIFVPPSIPLPFRGSQAILAIYRAFANELLV
jgi:hypothetical protein